MKATEPGALKVAYYFDDSTNALLVYDLFKDGAALGQHLAIGMGLDATFAPHIFGFARSLNQWLILKDYVNGLRDSTILCFNRCENSIYLWYTNRRDFDFFVAAVINQGHYYNHFYLNIRNRAD